MVYKLNTCKFDLIVSIKMHLYFGQDTISFETLHYRYIYTTCLIFMKFTAVDYGGYMDYVYQITSNIS